MTQIIDVFGSFGFGNLGDEIIPNCIVRAAESTGRAVAVRTFSRYDDVLVDNIVEHKDYLKSDLNNLMLISGGGVIENRKMSCFNRAMSKKKGVNASKTVPFGISVEPGVRFGLVSKLDLRYKLRAFDCIYVRDKLSSDVLKSLAPQTNQKLIGDLGLWCSGESQNLDIPGIPEKYIVFIPSDNWMSENFYNWISKELIRIAKHFELPVFIVPISVLAGKDTEVCAKILEISRRLDSRAQISLLSDQYVKSSFAGEDLAYVLARSNLTISMRLHGCVISYAQKTPFLALAYHPKLHGFASTIEWDFAVLPNFLPKLQSQNTYGYSFEDLHFESGDLLHKAIEVLKKQKYDLLDHYKEMQSNALAELFTLT